MNEDAQLQAYQLARKEGAAQTILALRERINSIHKEQLDLADYAGPAGTLGLIKKEALITEIEDEIEQLERVASGQELAEERVIKLASLQIAPTPRGRPSSLAERAELGLDY
jgi:hypothetical protein